MAWFCVLWRRQALLEDRLIREAESSERAQFAREQHASLRHEVENLMQLHRATTKDYLDLRQRHQEKVRLVCTCV